jgi:hypothetical protein
MQNGFVTVGNSARFVVLEAFDKWAELGNLYRKQHSFEYQIEH